jgi:hypothetical protein
MNKPSIEKIEFYQLTLAIEYLSDKYNIDQSLYFGDITKNIPFDPEGYFQISNFAEYHKHFWKEFGKNALFVW